MPNYRRELTRGGTWVFTLNLLERRRNDLLIAELDRLRNCVALERSRRPFSVVAWVVSPDHMHWIWRLPEDDADFATRWRRIKTDFSLSFPKNRTTFDGSGCARRTRHLATPLLGTSDQKTMTI